MDPPTLSAATTALLAPPQTAHLPMPSDTGADNGGDGAVRRNNFGVGRQIKGEGGWLRSALDKGGKRCGDHDKSCAEAGSELS